MLYTLGDPVSFVLLLVATLIALTLHGWLTSLVAVRSGSAQLVPAGRRRPDPRRHLDAYGVLAALIGGIGWSVPVARPTHRRTGALIAVALTGGLVLIAVGMGLLLTLHLSAGVSTDGSAVTELLRNGTVGGALGQRALLISGVVFLSTGVLSLLPLPPLAASRLLFGLAPRSQGWQQAEYQLTERNFGVLALLVMSLLVPGLLYAIVNAFVSPLAQLATGG